jgi:hypothetical protein
VGPRRQVTFKGKAGTYRDTGKRYKQGELPKQELDVFQP